MQKRPRSNPNDIGDLMTRLCAEYPHCFKQWNARPLPLKIGIREELRERLDDSVSDDLLQNTLAAYCSRPAYHQALWARGLSSNGTKNWEVDLEYCFERGYLLRTE